MSNKILFILLIIFSIIISITAFLFNNEMLGFPLLLSAVVIASLGFFQPEKNSSLQGKAAFFTLIAWGVFSICISLVLDILVPVYGKAWGLEYHAEDAMYPVVNDGHENCVITFVIFLIYFTISGFMRMKAGVKRTV
jgi:hypothetical protein